MLEAISFVVSFLALVGIWLVEQGVPGMNTAGLGGYPNGATGAFSAYLAVGIASFGVATFVWRVLGGVQRRPAGLDADPRACERFAKLALMVIGAELAFALYLLLAEGALAVVAGRLEKGDFKAQVSNIAYFGQVELVPMLAALCGAVYRHCHARGREKLLMGAVLFVAALTAATWGEKAGVIVALVPAIVILIPRPRPVRVAFYTFGAFLASSLLASYYQRLTFNSAMAIVTARATVGAGDTPWYIWELHRQHVAFPPYSPTLVPFVGGKIATSLGIASRADPDTWAMHDFQRVMTLVAKDWVPEVNTVTSHVTGTPFAEGVMAFGSPGFLIMAILAGIVTAVNAGMLRGADRARRPLLTAMVATYFGVATMPWLNGGGVTGLLNVPLVAYLGVVALVGQAMLVLCGLSGHRSAPVRAFATVRSVLR